MPQVPGAGVLPTKLVRAHGPKSKSKGNRVFGEHLSVKVKHKHFTMFPDISSLFFISGVVCFKKVGDLSFHCITV